MIDAAMTAEPETRTRCAAAGSRCCGAVDHLGDVERMELEHRLHARVGDVGRRVMVQPVGNALVTALISWSPPYAR